MKRFITTIFRFFFRLFLVICCVILVILILIFSFPEKISSEVMKKINPNVFYSVDSIAWRKNGADFYDLKLIIPGSTGNFHRVSLRFGGGKKYFISISNGNVDYSKIIRKKVKKDEQKEDKSFSFNNFPLNLVLTAENINLKTYSGINGKVNLNLKISPLTVTQAFLTASLVDKGRLDISAFQCNEHIGLRLRIKNIDISPFWDFKVFDLSSIKINSEISAEGNFSSKLLTKFNAKIYIVSDSIEFPDKIKAEGLNTEIYLSLNNAMDFNFTPEDKYLYYLKAFNGNVKCGAKSIAADKIDIDDLDFSVELNSGIIALKKVEMNVFDGKIKLDAGISRKKVKGKRKWKFKYDVKLCVTNLDAMKFCNTFDFNKNKMSGNFSGCINTMIFGKSVKKLNGELQSDNPGTLYFPEAEKYIAGMQASMQKQIFDMMVERLKIYPYNFSIISLKYDLSKKTTEIDFKFSGADEYKFSLFYDSTWIDAIKLVKMLQ